MTDSMDTTCEELPEIDWNATKTPRGKTGDLIGNILPEQCDANVEENKRFWVVTARYAADPPYPVLYSVPGKFEVFAAWRDNEKNHDGGYEMAKENARLKTDAIEENDKIRGYAVYGDFTQYEVEEQVWAKGRIMLPDCSYERVTSWQGREFADSDQNLPREERVKNMHRKKVTTTVFCDYGTPSRKKEISTDAYFKNLRETMLRSSKE